MSEVHIYYNNHSKNFFTQQQDLPRINPLCRSTVQEFVFALNGLKLQLEGSIIRLIFGVLSALISVLFFCNYSRRNEEFINFGFIFLGVSILLIIAHFDIKSKSYDEISGVCNLYQVLFRDCHNATLEIKNPKFVNEQVCIAVTLAPTDLTSKLLAEDPELVSKFVNVVASAKHRMVIHQATTPAEMPRSGIQGPLITDGNGLTSQQHTQNYPDLVINSQ